MGVSKEQFIGQVDQLYDGYKPNMDVVQQLGFVDLTTVSAPTGMGKNTIMQGTGLPRVISETIRARRLNNGRMEVDGVDYDFRGKKLDDILAAIKHGDYVQIGMGHARDSFYGSRITCYPALGPALIDVMTAQVESLRQLPFRSVEATMIVAPTYENWITWLMERGPMPKEDWVKRRKEARVSLRDGLEDERYMFIYNDHIPTATDELSVFARDRIGRRVRPGLARQAAAAILRRLNED